MDGTTDLFSVTNPAEENEDDEGQFPSSNSVDTNESDLYTFLNVSRTVSAYELLYWGTN